MKLWRLHIAVDIVVAWEVEHRIVGDSSAVLMIAAAVGVVVAVAVAVGDVVVAGVKVIIDFSYVAAVAAS